MRDQTTATNARVRVTHSGPVLPFRVPLVPWWIAVPAMILTVVAMVGVAAVAVMT